jgi:hypothetical protein
MYIPKEYAGKYCGNARCKVLTNINSAVIIYINKENLVDIDFSFSIIDKEQFIKFHDNHFRLTIDEALKKTESSRK